MPSSSILFSVFVLKVPHERSSRGKCGRWGSQVFPWSCSPAPGDAVVLPPCRALGGEGDVLPSACSFGARAILMSLLLGSHHSLFLCHTDGWTPTPWSQTPLPTQPPRPQTGLRLHAPGACRWLLTGRTSVHHTVQRSPGPGSSGTQRQVDLGLQAQVHSARGHGRCKQPPLRRLPAAAQRTGAPGPPCPSAPCTRGSLLHLLTGPRPGWTSNLGRRDGAAPTTCCELGLGSQGREPSVWLSVSLSLLRSLTPS